ncbi:hypothetical protein CDL12_18272 [Handroanthus impetiginosus]|uniref:Uncharacterized protein n=1 Tax=Handroanthus impetiginosus TaxID=429701 RepID=A0A2G9GV37_9LAMI|nr:hypothetical protein CDL12_18272 [Handroanthus impetiginosus]
MDRTISSLAQKSSISNEEESGLIMIDVGSENNGLDVRSLALVGRVVTTKVYSTHSLRSNIVRLLNPVKGLDFQMIGEDRFMLAFHHPFDHCHAMKGYPRLLDRQALILAKVPPNTDPIHINLDWIQIVAVATQIGNWISEFIDAIQSKSEVGLPYMQIRIKLHCCPNRYEDGSVDNGEPFEFGNWLMASTNDSITYNTRMPPHPIHGNIQKPTSPNSPNPRSGLSILEFTTQRTETHNTPNSKPTTLSRVEMRT